MGSRCFSRANEELRKRGWSDIDWRVDGPLNEEEDDDDAQERDRIEEKIEKGADDTEDGKDDEIVDC